MFLFRTINKNIVFEFGMNTSSQIVIQMGITTFLAYFTEIIRHQIIPTKPTF